MQRGLGKGHVSNILRKGGPRTIDLENFKEYFTRARKIQEIAVNSSESDNEKSYALGWLHCLDSVLDVINKEINK